MAWWKKCSISHSFSTDPLWSSCDRPQNPAGFHRSVRFGVNSALLYSSLHGIPMLSSPHLKLHFLPLALSLLLFFFFCIHDAAKVPLPFSVTSWNSKTVFRVNSKDYTCTAALVFFYTAEHKTLTVNVWTTSLLCMCNGPFWLMDVLLVVLLLLMHLFFKGKKTNRLLWR